MAVAFQYESRIVLEMRGGTPVPMEAAEKLARHLRENPDDTGRDSSELATEFALPQPFVHDLMRNLRGEKPEEPTESRGNGLGASIASPFVYTRGLFRKLTVRPVMFIVVSTAIALILGILLSRVGVIDTMPRGIGFQIDGVWTLSLSLGVLILHFACYYRTAMARVVFHGAVWAWLLCTTVLLVSVWLRTSSNDAIKIMLELLLVELLMLFAAGFYVCVSLIFSTVGAYVRVRHHDRAEQSMGRQEQLTRLFDLQERLTIVKSGNTQKRGLFEHPIAEWIRRHLLLVITCSALLGTLFGILGTVIMPSASSTRDSGTLILFACSELIGLGIMFIGLTAVGFFARNLKELFVHYSLYSVASYLPILLPLPGFGFDSLAQHLQGPRIIASLSFSFIIVMIAYLGRIIEQRAERDRLIQEHDPATLYGEMVKIQWRLSPSTKTVCVMVVDAAKSSTMKVGANPLEVEYTFREYQSFISEISNRFAGRVHSTAGDGAVVAFPSCPEAFEAARQIQTNIERFNRDVNRLVVPFRLRIGLHSGEVVAELDQVQFTAVIDVAAHIEAAAPVEGIAVSQPVAEQLEGERFAALESHIDGFKVHIALAPKL